jgi:FtsH-binding integral membrane protein
MNEINEKKNEIMISSEASEQQPYEVHQTYHSHNISLDIPTDKKHPSHICSQSDLEAQRIIIGDQEEIIEAKLRIGFIRKVYGILSIQLLITVIFVAFAFEPRINLFLYKNIGLFYGAMTLNLTILFSMVCFPQLFRTVPTNYILLFIWTFCEGYMVATVASFNPPEIVLTAAALTALVSLGLTFYAFTTKTDFTFIGGFLFVMTLVMLFWGIFILIFGFFLYTLYCVLGVILFTIYLIFDTQLILGRFGNKYSLDDYILASLNIYIDIIQLFLYILDLLRRNQ